jgi:hypothetical protein
MKTCMMLLIAVTMMSTSCNGQDIAAAKVPSVVLNAVKEKYPTALDVDWEKHGNQYDAELDLTGGLDVTLRIDEAGMVLMQKQDIAVAELPKAILEAIQNGYKEYRLEDADKIEKGGTVYYQVELDRNWRRDVKLVFSNTGQEEKAIAYWD